MPRRCKVCDQPIPQGRLEAIPDTETCTEHSEVQAYTGFMTASGPKGTGSYVQFIPQNKEAQRIARRAHRRSR